MATGPISGQRERMSRVPLPVRVSVGSSATCGAPRDSVAWDFEPLREVRSVDPLYEMIFSRVSNVNFKVKTGREKTRRPSLDLQLTSTTRRRCGALEDHTMYRPIHGSCSPTASRRSRRRRQSRRLPSDRQQERRHLQQRRRCTARPPDPHRRFLIPSTSSGARPSSRGRTSGP